MQKHCCYHKLVCKKPRELPASLEKPSALSQLHQWPKTGFFPKALQGKTMDHIRDRFRSQWLFLIGALLSLAAIFAYQIQRSHDSIERQEQAHLANQASVSADILERHLAISDALLNTLLSIPL